VEAFELTADNVIAYLVRRGVLSHGVRARVGELEGGVSATVLTVRAPGTAVVVKQALARLKVDDDWRAKQERTEVEAAAMRLCGRLTPGRVPRVLDNDASAHVVVMELLPDDAPNWQSEVEAGRAHVAVGAWAGETLGLWHARTAGVPEVAAAFDDYESFEQLRLSPFHECVIERLPEVAGDVTPRIEELREHRCFVHGDFAMKNTLVGRDRNWVLDFEVAHYGNPIFDLGFFLSFVVLSAVRWPALGTEMRALADGFARGYIAAAGQRFAWGDADVTAHTGCLMLARTDGKSPARFLDGRAREQARAAGRALLRTPERGLWQWI
jgi:tRNA A-37 threonylcarbamoyl transferase component Bud32